MMWNWQDKGWPNFIYDSSAFEQFNQNFIYKAGALSGCMKHISEDDKETLKVNLIRDEALKTSEIEGEILNRDSLQSSIRKHLGLKTDNRRVSPAEQGISEMMVDLYQNAIAPLSHDQLYKWHEMLTNGRRDLKEIGSYRSHDEPMQIVSGEFLQPTIHYEAPPSEVVAKEMEQFVDWFNATAPREKDQLPTLIRAGVAHIYFESIHPFEDGNGRIGRAISEKALSQSLGNPTLIAISQTIEKKRKNYYAALQSGSKGLDINQWLHYFCEMVLAAQDYTQNMLDFLIDKGKFYKRFDGTLNERQAKAVERMFREGVDGFKGGLSAENYINITQATRPTATRDLRNLVEQSAFVKKGERKYTRYFLNI